MRAQQPLYAVLDPASGDPVRRLLRESELEMASLYDGASARALVSVAPHLVRLPPDAPLLDTLTTDGWGKSWAIYLTCDRPFADVRRHLRKFLEVLHEGKEVVFRFYDPRVLRHFLPSCTARELRELFGPLTSYFAEGRDPDLLWKLTAENAATGGERITVL